MRRLAVTSGLCFLIAATAYGQGGGNAAMNGTVTDPSGAAIIGARVTMTQIGTEVKRSASTNENGHFTIPALPPASYRVAVEAGVQDLCPGGNPPGRPERLSADPNATGANRDGHSRGNRHARQHGHTRY